MWPRANEASLYDWAIQWDQANRAACTPIVAQGHFRRITGLIWQFGLKMPADLTPGACQAAVNYWVNERGLSAGSVQTYFASLKSLCRFLVAAGALVQNPTHSVRRPGVGRPDIAFLDKNEIAHVLRLGQCFGAYLPIKTAIYTGLRRQELAKLAYEDLDFELRLVRVRALNAKGHRPRTVPLAAELIEDLCLLGNGSGPIFGRRGQPAHVRSLNRLLGPIQDRMPKISAWHIFRHTFASILAQRGVSLAKISQWLGHASYELTLRYYANLAADRYDEDINRLTF